MERLKVKANEKTAQLLNAFREKENMTVADIMNLLQCNRQSAYNYLSRFQDAGYRLHKELKNKKAYFSLQDNPSNNSADISFLPITGKSLYKYEIIKCLFEGPADITTFRNIAISQSYLYKLLNEMITDNEIIKSNSHYHLNAKKIPVTLSLSSNSIHTLATSLAVVPKGNPYYTQLQSINNKINIVLGNISSEDSVLDNYIIYGRKHFQFESISQKLKKLTTFDYPTKVLEINYLTRSNQAVSTLLATGMIVYALEKDAVYLMGKDFSSEEKKNIIIKLDSILHVTETEKEHSFFLCDEFREIYTTMFSISVEPPVDVVVEFENVFNIKKKLEQLCTQRPTAQRLEITDEKIVYRDTIRGINDFANYLRRFGRSFTVIAPQELADTIRFSVNRSLERYLQEEA